MASEQSSYKCVVGDKVSFEYENYKGTGIVKFVGSLLPTKQGRWVGIERDEIDSDESSKPEGYNGKLADMQYFQCKKNRGILVPYHLVKLFVSKATVTSNVDDAMTNAGNPTDDEPADDKAEQPHTQQSESGTSSKPTQPASTTNNGTTQSSSASKPGKKQKEVLDPLELAQKFKRNLKTQTDKTLNQIKQTQSEISSKLKQHEEKLRRKEIREVLATNKASATTNISSRTAQLLQQQKLLSQTVSQQRRQSDIEQFKQKQNVEITFSDEQLRSIDVMSEIFMQQTKQPLKTVVQDIEELQLRQEKFLENFSKSSIWFNRQQRQRLNEMSKVMNKVPDYRRKLISMQQRIQDINTKVSKLKRDTQQLKHKIDFHY